MPIAQSVLRTIQWQSRVIRPILASVSCWKHNEPGSIDEVVGLTRKSLDQVQRSQERGRSAFLLSLPSSRVVTEDLGQTSSKVEDSHQGALA